MGGVATRDIAKLNDICNQLTITPAGVVLLAQNGIHIDISPETISDKSKANLIGKALVCLQAIWFVLQCIARHLAGYPLTLLEVHTSVHAICAVIMYIIWWKVCYNYSYQM